ncbi:MAG: ComF family protein [Pseudomonadales bacterium]|nr:ComF family protein [Pseudomonadales bacterium]
MFAYLPGLICLLCHIRLSVREAGGAGEIQLCSSCLASLPWRNSAAPFETTPDLDPLIAPLDYRACTADWVVRAKRSAGLVEARVLGALLARALVDAYPFPERRPEFLIPVPLSWQRLFRRGHNQAALIAGPVHRALGIPVAHTAVRRTRHSPIQPGRGSRGRRENVEAVFAARRRWQGESLAILDDVYTTGATAAALARCLRQAGAGDIHVWCATRSRAESDEPA